MNQLATFAAGCFWGVQARFDALPGVVSTRVGYTGGDIKSPSYEDVCRGDTNHAEAVEVTFAPDLITYENLLTVFWENHNPTLFNRQGPDVGSQYRSAIFYHDETQRDLAQLSKQALEQAKVYNNPIVTELVPAQNFYEAESYHQHYLKKHPRAACPIDNGRKN